MGSRDTGGVTPEEVRELRTRLAEADETLRAIRHGEVDALLMIDAAGERVYTLRSADAPYRALVEQMKEGAVTLNNSGAITYANRSFADLLGVPLEQVIGSTIDAYVDDGDRQTLRGLLHEGAGTLRTRLRSRSRPQLEAHISVSHLSTEDAEHRTLIVTDLSTLTKVQRESQSKDEFLAMLAHELRNPLAPIRTGLQVLKLSPTDESAERAREMMDRQLSQMVRLIDDLLDVSRVSRGQIALKKERIDLRTVIGLAVETSLPLVEAGRHELAIHVPQEPLPLEADPTRLGQVFSNLLNNAAKYTPDGGRISLDVQRDGDTVSVRVTDNGVGIPAAVLPDVFEMFSQVGRHVGRAQGGLGIGLTLVRRLTEMHDGDVTAESAGPGKGSTFTVRLPLGRAEAAVVERRRPEPAAPSADAPPGLRVLVVDDNVDGATMLSMLARMHGHETEMAYDGPEAVAQVARLAPHVVFLDIGLPGLDGYEVARQVRMAEAGRPGPPTVLVALTGWGSDEDKARSREAGFNLHLTKPVDPAAVEAVLARLSAHGALASDHPLTR